MRKGSATGFGVFFDPTKSTSGQRFFEQLCLALSDRAKPLAEGPSAILFNVSAPITAIIRAWLNRQRIVLRIDGLYLDRLSPAFLATFSLPLRMLFSLGLKYRRAHDFLAFWANLINENYTAFVRIALADRVIYQSRFSRQVHERYFPKKPSDIIVNGAVFHGDRRQSRTSSERNEIRLVTIYDEWKPAKRIHDVVEFVHWAHETKGAPLRLTILGYTGKLPDSVSTDIRRIIETAHYIQTMPRFTRLDGQFRQALLEGDVYVTFSYRDPCPNTVVEAMAHGLPVVAPASGGVPDIVGNAGVLIAADDFERGFFSDHRYGIDFPRIDFEVALKAIYLTMSDEEGYRERVRERFVEVLGMEMVADRYAGVMRAVAP